MNPAKVQVYIGTLADELEPRASNAGQTTKAKLVTTTTHKNNSATTLNIIIVLRVSQQTFYI
jgi:hypothetical protein